MSASSGLARAEPQAAVRGSGPLQQAMAVLGFVRAKPFAGLCGFALLAITLVAIFASVDAPYRPDANTIAILKGPSATHLLGTDNFGRDVLSRIIYGGRTAMAVGAISTAVATVLALLIGVSGAYFGGALDFLSGRLVELVQALPGIILLIALLAVIGRSTASVAVVLGILSGIVGSRVLRGATFTVASQPFIESAKAMGCSELRIVLRYLVPNVAPLVIVLATINIGSSIVAAAALSFIGYGIPPPASDWGQMLSGAGRLYMVQAPWLFYAPTLALALVVFSVNMLGDALRDSLDPRLRGG